MSKRFDDSKEIWLNPDDSTLPAAKNRARTPDPSGETRVDGITTSQRETIPNPSARRRPVLVHIDEGRRVGDRFILAKPEIFIGRESNCDLSFQDGRISRQHARILWENMESDREEPRCSLEDLGSRNGTLVNGQRIERTGLHDGDRILIGSTLLAFYVKDEQELSLDQQLLQMATTDGLTGLANRYYFLTVARREIERARRYQRDLSLIMLDLDHFKSINDTQGHAAGDMVLRQLARILVVTMREGDLIGRVGGEEFAILLPETALEGASATAERIRQRVSDHNFQFHGIDMHVTVSLGVAEFTYSYATREAFFEAADKALYEAKSKGRNCVCEAPKPPSTPPTSVQ